MNGLLVTGIAMAAAGIAGLTLLVWWNFFRAPAGQIQEPAPRAGQSRFRSLGETRDT